MATVIEIAIVRKWDKRRRSPQYQTNSGVEPPTPGTVLGNGCNLLAPPYLKKLIEINCLLFDLHVFCYSAK